MTEKLNLEYVPLSTLVRWQRNPKLHDQGALAESFYRHGFRDPLEFDTNLNGGAGGIATGNGREETLLWLKTQGREPPRGIVLLDNGDWGVPVLFGLDAESEAAAEAYAVDHNNLTMMGGSFSAWSLAGLYDSAMYTKLLNDLAQESVFPVSVDADNLDSLNQLLLEQSGVTEKEKSGPTRSLASRKLGLDLIFTINSGAGECCVAIRAGWKFGIQSGRPINSYCPYGRSKGRHEVLFVDNEFKDYNHAAHLETVSYFRPRYATVRDLMTQDQCKEAGIPWYSFEQIIAWAEELSQYAQNVIVIPKYDCLDRIPARFMLGYSVPSSYGGTPLPAEMFQGRRVHLLGGSWKKQLFYLNVLGDDVVSLDNNNILLLDGLGTYVLPDGQELSLDTLLLEPWPLNHREIALALSVGYIALKVKEICAGNTMEAA